MTDHGNDGLGGRAFGDEDTQEIPVVGDRPVAAHAPDAPRPSSGSAPGYTILPADAFAPKTSPKRKRLTMAAAASVVVAGLIAVGVYGTVGGGDDAPAAPRATTVVAAKPPPSDEQCPTRTSGNVTTGRDAGDTESGVGVIKAFNYAYYVKRDANAVNEFVLPAARESVIPSIANLQKAIDDLPASTTHCLTITDLGEGLNRVDLAQIVPGPGGDRITFHQMIQTTSENGRWLIVSNTAVA